METAVTNVRWLALTRQFKPGPESRSSSFCGDRLLVRGRKDSRPSEPPAARGFHSKLAGGAKPS